MKNLWLKLTFLTLLLSATFYSQDKPKAILVDMFGPVSCEDIWARIDAFFIDLQNRPDARAYINIQVTNNKIETGVEIEQAIKGLITLKTFPKTRINFVRSTSPDDFRVEFWSIPPGADLPKFSAAKWDLSFPKNKKPYILSSSSSADGPCPDGEYLNLNVFAEYLTANPKARGNIVIKTSGRKAFRGEKNNLIKIISDKYKISGKRLRFFHVNRRNSYKSQNPDVEVWILP